MVLVDSTHPQQARRLAAALGPASLSQASQGFPVEGISYDDDPKPLTSRSCWSRIERMYEMERFSISRHG
jgi:hypothetical protein